MRRTSVLSPKLLRGAAAIAMSLALVHCGRARTEAAIERPDMSLTHMTIYQYDNGHLSFKAQVDRAAGNWQNMQLHKIRVQHRGMEKTGAVVIESDEGTLFLDHYGVALDKNVTITDAFGRVAKVDRMVYAPEQQSFSIPGAVSLVGPDITVSAHEVKGLLGADEFILNGPVDGTLKLDR